MRDESSHGAGTRERVAPNLYRRRTKSGDVRFEAVFRDTDGRQRARRLEARTERAAIKETRAVLAERDGGTRIVAAGLTLDDVAQRDYFPTLDGLAAAGRRSRRNVDDERDRYRLHVEPRLGGLLLGEIDTRAISELVAAMRARKPKPYAESTIANVLGVVAGIYRVARKRGYVSRSPLDGLDEAERPRPKVGDTGRILDEPQLGALVRHAPDNYRAAVALLAYTGLRLSEACGLRWGDIDLVEGELTVRRQLEAGRGDRATAVVDRLKSRASYRTVPIFPALERELVQLLEQELAADRGRPGDLVLGTRRGGPVSQRNVAQRGVTRAALNAGLGHVTPQDLRRSFCSLAGRRGVDPVEAPQLTGHSPEVWARHYARSFGKAQRDEARDRMLEHGFGALDDAPAADTSAGPLTRR